MTLSAINLGVERGGNVVLDRIDCELRQGEITAIVGPNGSGKSSLLMSLTGLLPCETGSIELDGGSIAALSPKERAKRVGYLPQNADIAWDVAVENLVALGRLPHGDRSSEAIEAAMEALDLQSLRNRPASQLSGGECARALLARVLAGEPGWILADEPLAALDLAHQLNLIGQFKTQAASGVGVVIVLHDLALAMNHADRVVVLHDGTVAADGPPDLALGEDTIVKVWDVSARWIGETGARALSHGSINAKRAASD